MTIRYTPIGEIRSPYDAHGDVPRDTSRQSEGRVVLDETYEAGLDGLEEFSHVVVLAHLDGIDSARLTARPPHVDDPEVGVFATRSPHRPNPLAPSVVELIVREGPTLHVRGLDLFDGTPVVDLKPYVDAVDGADVSLGWLDDAR